MFDLDKTSSVTYGETYKLGGLLVDLEHDWPLLKDEPNLLNFAWARSITLIVKFNDFKDWNHVKMLHSDLFVLNSTNDALKYSQDIEKNILA